jgi:L-asparagine transporter-like permease
MGQVGVGGTTVTPTLAGRWQTRLAMLATLGLAVTIVFALLSRDARVFAVLMYVFGFGVVWDWVWIRLQQLRWDRDWPAAFQVGSGLVEGAWLYALIALVGLPLIARNSVGLGFFAGQYGLVWLVTFIWVQGPMRAVFPRWRYHGGRLV